MAPILFLMAVLIFSCIGMTVLLSLKHWELATGKMVFSGTRESLSRWSHRALHFIEYRLPARARMLWMSLLYWLRGGIRTALARMLLSTEQTLERTLYFLRHKLVAERSSDSQVSAFLQEVAEHKKRLTRGNRRRALQRISE